MQWNSLSQSKTFLSFQNKLSKKDPHGYANFYLAHQSFIGEIKVQTNRQVNNIKICNLDETQRCSYNFRNHTYCCKHHLSENIHSNFSCSLILSICRIDLQLFWKKCYDLPSLNSRNTHSMTHMLVRWQSNHSI